MRFNPSPLQCYDASKTRDTIFFHLHRTRPSMGYPPSHPEHGFVDGRPLRGAFHDAE